MVLKPLLRDSMPIALFLLLSRTANLPLEFWVGYDYKSSRLLVRP